MPDALKAVLQTRDRSAVDIVRSWDGAQRAELSKVFRKRLPELRRSFEGSSRLVLLGAALDITPAQFASLVDWWSRYRLDEAQAEFAVQQICAKGADWVREMTTRATARRGIPAWLGAPLFLEYDLPLPSNAQYWQCWFQDMGFEMRPGTDWQRSFVAACAVPGVFNIDALPLQGMQAGVRQAADRLRALGELQDATLCDALISVWERGDRPGAQRNARVWLDLLGLTGALRDVQGRLIAAAPVLEASVLKLVIEQLVNELTTTELSELAQSVLYRKEKGVKVTVLKALAHVREPDPGLVAAVQQVADSSDRSAAKLAAGLLAPWGLESSPPQTVGLWCAPAGATLAPAPLLEPAMLADAATFAEVWARLDGEEGAAEEQFLAALVRAVFTQGTAAVTGRIRNERQLGWSTPCKRLVSQWAQLEQPLAAGMGFEQWMKLVWKVIRPHLRAFSQLEEVVMERYAEAVYALGVVPQLLSTPTHQGNYLDGSEFARRLDDYHDAGAAVLPLDLSVALGRLTPSQIPARVRKCAVAVTGCTLSVGEVVRAWGMNGPAAPTLEFLEPGSLHPGRRMVLHGATLPTAALLGLEAPPWTKALPCTGRLTSARALQLLPVVPGRAAAVILHQLAGADDARAISSLESVGGVARPFGEVLAFATLALASQVVPAGRDRVAAVLLNAWHEERLTAADLLAAWRSPWRTHWPELNPARVAACLLPVAAAGGLALVWPLLCELADELAAAEKLPTSAAGLAEELAALAPEVVAARAAGFAAPAQMPAVAKLAASKGNSKAAQAARQLVSSGVLDMDQE